MYKNHFCGRFHLKSLKVLLKLSRLTFGVETLGQMLDEGSMGLEARPLHLAAKTADDEAVK